MKEAEVNGPASCSCFAGLRATAPNCHALQVRALGPGFQNFRYAVPDGRGFERPGEAIVGPYLRSRKILRAD